MANTAPTKSCLKAPVRNPWVADDVTESSNSSSRATSVHSQPTTSHSTPTPASHNGSHPGSAHETAIEGTPKHAALSAQTHADGGIIVVTSSSSPPVAQQQQHHYHHHHYAGSVPAATDLAMQQQIQHQQKVQQQIAPPRPFATPSSGASSHASSSTSSTAHLPTCAPPQAHPVTSAASGGGGGGGVGGGGQHHGVPVSHHMTSAGQQPLPQTLLCPPGHNPHLQPPQPQVSQGAPHQPVVVHTGIQKPWMDPKALWTSPSSPGAAPAIFTVGGPGVEPTPLCQAQHYPYYAPHLAHGAPAAPPPGAIVHAGYMPASGAATSTQWSTATSGGPGAPPGMVLVGPGGGSAVGLRGGGVVGVGGAVGGEEWLSRCQRCNEVCFVAAQAVFVAGILTGFSLLIAGAVFHRQHQFSDLQVLVYIGAMVSLVCVVLLVIFCAMRQNQRARRNNIRYQGHAPFLEHEAVPLRTFESANHSAPPHFQMTTTATVTADPGTNKDFLRHPDLTNHSVCLMGGPTPHYVPVSSDTAYIQAQPPHARLLQTRVCEDEGAGDVRYNRLWKQPHKHKLDNTTKL